MTIATGDRCECEGACRYHAGRCSAVHGLDNPRGRGIIALRNLEDLGVFCDMCAATFEKRRRKEPPANADQGDLWGA